MNRRRFLATLPASVLAGSLLARADTAPAANDWPCWRGPRHDGIAAPQTIPTVWAADKNIVWQTQVLGRGHGSATVVGDHVLLATADEPAQKQGILCLDRKTGKQRWHTQIHQGGFSKKGNAKSTHASATPACDGERVYINFFHDGAVHATALDLAGKIVWQTKICDFVMHQGFGASPAIYGPLVLVAADNKGGGVLMGLDRVTGKAVWTRNRPKQPNYTSPIIFKIDGKDQLLFTGCDLITSLDPLTGKPYWELAGSTTECVTSIVTDGKRVYSSGGYPRNHVSAIKADGSGIAWENKARVYVPSMLVREGHLYAVMDEGLAVCWKSDTGEELWKGRLGGTFSSSPVMVGDTILATNEVGRTYLFKATPKEFDLIGENRLGDEVFATPTICGGRIYMRVANKSSGPRQEVLYCIGDRA